MTDKVQKIREEVERLINELIQERGKYYSSDVDDACILELQNVLTYIDSLQEEPNILPVFDEGYWERLGEEIRIDTIEEVKEIFKKELLRLQKEQKMKFETEPTERRAGSLDCINSILSSFEFVDFEEEPVSSIWHDASEPPIIDKTFLLVAPNGNSSLCLWGGKELHSVTIGGGHSVLCKGDIYSYIDDLLNLDNSCNFGKNLKEEPVSEELEEAIDTYLKSYWGGEKEKQEWPFLKKMVIYFANWQKAKNESTTKDLGEYINELSKQFPEVSFAKLSRIAVRVAKWQKEQLMAKAIDAKIGSFTNGTIYDADFNIDSNLKDDDKVKIIVVKED